MHSEQELEGVMKTSSTEHSTCFMNDTFSEIQADPVRMWMLFLISQGSVFKQTTAKMPAIITRLKSDLPDSEQERNLFFFPAAEHHSPVVFTGARSINLT